MMSESDPFSAHESAAREDFIDRIIALAQQLYDNAGGRAKRAQYSGDIYVCKNFTVHLFRENCEAFRMAEYPDIPLIIPNNQKKADCAPYVYGVDACGYGVRDLVALPEYASTFCLRLPSLPLRKALHPRDARSRSLPPS